MLFLGKGEDTLDISVHTSMLFMISLHAKSVHKTVAATSPEVLFYSLSFATDRTLTSISPVKTRLFDQSVKNCLPGLRIVSLEQR